MAQTKATQTATNTNSERPPSSDNETPPVRALPSTVKAEIAL